MTTVFAVSGAAGWPQPSPARESAARTPARVTAPEKCPRTLAAVRFYAGRLAYWAELRSGAVASRAGRGDRHVRGCPRYLAHVLQRKSRAARAAFERYLRSRAYHWDYERWMPAWMIRLATCEERLQWSYNDGTYEGSFAFYFGTWDGYAPDGFPSTASSATPRQQMIVVYRVARAVRGGVGTAWGCWRGSQHAWVRGGLPEYGFRG